jgi:predicted SprT family Zn-dependent metalloprotease
MIRYSKLAVEESGLPTRVSYAPRGEPTKHAFFRSVPGLDNNELVLRHQQAFVDKPLSYSLAHTHVLYCMNNETVERVEWGD